MFQVHEVGYDIKSLYNRENDENDDKNAVRNRCECDTYFKNGNGKQDPESSPDKTLGVF